ncbi:signal peptidase I [Ornithinibacillus salinisoli]|uniref:Signal peptidase I n=1 Tax=Ornithinibacillus salinisoli TaxID=1848459 RepID=A0ABW4W499_9BACI
MKKWLVCFPFLFVLFGCQSITDNSTPEEPKQIDDVSSYLVVEHLSDSMDRGNHEYEGTIVINEGFYKENSFQRGEVVYYKTPELNEEYSNATPSEYNIARIIALPGESIKIKDGQVFIDNKKLDTFYGKSLRSGLTKEEFLDVAKKFLDVTGTKDNAYNTEFYEEYFSRNMEEFKLSNNQLFVLGDNGPRSIDSTIFGPIDTDEIGGKVVGIK